MIIGVDPHKATEIALVGSVARADDGPDSDVDFLATFAPGATLFDRSRLLGALRELLGVKVDVLSVGGLKQQFGGFLDGNVLCGHAHDEFVHVVVVGGCHGSSVEFEEHRCGEPAQALVAVDEGVIVDDGLQQCGCLGPDVGIGVGAERAGLGARRRGGEQSDIADRGWISEQAACEFDQVVGVEELDRTGHSPRRRSASAWRCITDSAAAPTRSW